MDRTYIIQDGDSVYVKLDIAKEYLNLAICCFIEGRDYFCAIHLAGAAEEIFGKWLHEEDRISTINLRTAKQLHTEIYGETPSDKDIRRSLNWSKNTIKHMDDGNPHILLNPSVEAQKWIEMAIINHDKIGFPKSEMILKFEEHCFQLTEKAFASTRYVLETIYDGITAEIDTDMDDEEFG